MTNEQRAWCNEVGDLILRRLSFLFTPAQRLVLSHLALESGYGTARAAKMGFNFGNLTAGPSWTGKRWSDVGGDVDASGKRITQEWRAYRSPDDFIADYWHFLGPDANRGRYVLARNAIERGDLMGAAIALHEAGYYELDPVEYSKRWAAVKAQLEEIK